MDVRQQAIIDTQQNSAPFKSTNSDAEGLISLIALNAEIAHEAEFYRNYQERFEAALIKHPITTEKAFAYFGLLLGIFPPAAIFFQIFKSNPEPGIVLFFTFINLICTGAGYFSGKFVGRAVQATENYSFYRMLLVSPLLGVSWGIIAGGIGGLFIFIVGAFFGAICAAAVGAIAFPAFTIFHRILKRGDVIERNQFLPLSVGISLAISAFILGT